jgi:H+-translocating NAD(P) transhydrogenase subunit alpha
MVEAMKPGSVIVDIMAEMGGNVEMAEAGETITHKDVSIVGTKNIYSSIAEHASEMYARNIVNLLGLMVKDGIVNLNWQDEILAGAVVTRDGEIVNEQVKKFLGGK